MATIKLKRNSIFGKIPNADELADGELAINTADGKVFLKKSNGTVIEVGKVSSISWEDIDDKPTTLSGYGVTENSIDHNNLKNYSANKHVDHSLVSISAGTGLSGGGNLTASRTLSLATTGVTANHYGITSSEFYVPGFYVDSYGRMSYAASRQIFRPMSPLSTMNLNDATNYGIYSQDNGTYATTERKYPSSLTNQGGVLFVTSWSYPSNYYFQIYWTGLGFATRYSNGSEWSSWKQWI